MRRRARRPIEAPTRRRRIEAETAPAPPRCAIRPRARAARLSPARREQAGDGLSSRHGPRRDEGGRYGAVRGDDPGRGSEPGRAGRGGVADKDYLTEDTLPTLRGQGQRW